jgi:8-oxo-dGTP diphosphatase
MQKVIVAKTFVINANGLILTLRRSASDAIRPGTWDLPGGSVEDNEDPTDAAIRETEEESGLNVEDPQIFRVKTTSVNKYVIRLLYYVSADKQEITLSSEHDQYKWVTKEEFRATDIPSYYKDCLSYLPD